MIAIPGVNETIHDSKLRRWEDQVLGTYIVVVCVVCYFLNFFVFRHTYHLKKRSLFDILVATLAIDDAMHATISLMSAISCFNHRWVFGQIGCTVYGFTVFTAGTLSIMSITAISIVRHTAVFSGTFYKTIGIHHVVVCLGTIVVYSCAWASSALFLTHSYGNEPFGTACCLEWTKLSKPYVLGLFAGVFVIPVSVTAICYCRVISRTREREKILTNVKNKKKNNMATKIGIAVCVGFLITWAPYGILAFYWAFGDASVVSVRLTVFPSMFAKTSVICNPIIYFWLNPSCRPHIVSEWLGRIAVRFSSPIFDNLKPRDKSNSISVYSQSEKFILHQASSSKTKFLDCKQKKVKQENNAWTGDLAKTSKRGNDMCSFV